MVVAKDKEEAKAAVREIVNDRCFGEAGSTVVVEELLVGPEISVFALTNGKDVALMPPSQDHKRLLDGDQGPNTGGMGAYCPVPFVTAAQMEVVRTEVAQRVVDGFNADGTPYKGLIYCQMMLTEQGTRVASSSIPPNGGSIRVCLPICTYAHGAYV